MQGLGHVRPAVVQHDGAGVGIVLRAVVRGLCHFAQIGGKIPLGDLQIQKARHDSFGAGKHPVFAQRVQNRVRDLDGGLVVLLRRGQRAVALVFTEVRPVGKRRLAVGRVESGPLKRACQLLGDQIDQKFHACHLYPVIIFYIITDAAAVVQRQKRAVPPLRAARFVFGE